MYWRLFELSRVHENEMESLFKDKKSFKFHLKSSQSFKLNSNRKNKNSIDAEFILILLE